MNRKEKIFLFLVLFFIPFSGKTQNTSPGFDTTKGLKDYYKKYFPIGVAISPENLKGKESNLILHEFNSITPDNAMKMGPIHPEEDRYFWKESDSIVQYALHHGIRVRGHNLCWHEQTPEWIFKDQKGGTVSKEILLKRLKEHISQVVNRYKGKIYAWDVVNEAISDNDDEFYRNSPWFKICGEDYIIKAFQYAHEADPEALLFYNDYNSERPGKREKIYKLLKSLIDAGVPINGVGIQAHWSIFEPSLEEIRATLDKFSSLGLKIQITELDISVFPWEKEVRSLRSGENKPISEEAIKIQENKYGEIFKIFREYKGIITGITFWNLSDRHTWLDYYPVKGRKNYPLLFDQDLKPKSAYYKVSRF